MIDGIDKRILQQLDGNARMPLNEIARRIGLSSPSVSERLKRLEERGVIRGFTLDIDPEALGYTLQAIVRIRPLPGKVRPVEKLLQEMPQVIECDKVTGEDCYVARIVIRSIGELDLVVDQFALKAETNTSIIKSQPVQRRRPPLEDGR